MDVNDRTQVANVAGYVLLSEDDGQDSNTSSSFESII